MNLQADLRSIDAEGLWDSSLPGSGEYKVDCRVDGLFEEQIDQFQEYWYNSN